MELEIPAVPAGVMSLIAIFTPWAIALVNSPNWSSGWKRVVAIGVSVALALIVLLLYYAISGEAVPGWPVLIVLFVLVTQTSYGLVAKPSAARLEESAGVQ